MNGIILKGDEKSKRLYIEAYINANNIATYNIVRYDQPLKISDARLIKKLLAISAIPGAKRLFIIEVDPTLEAQNALLKTLEELDNETDFIFTNDSELLPTIISRCSVVVLNSERDSNSIVGNEDFAQELAGIEKKSDLLLWADKIFSEKKENAIRDLIIDLRGDLIKKINNNDYSNCYYLSRVLKSLDNNYSLVTSNNLNQRLVFERIILNS